MAACQRLGHEAEYRGRVEAGDEDTKGDFGVMARRITWWQAAETAVNPRYAASASRKARQKVPVMSPLFSQPQV